MIEGTEVSPLGWITGLPSMHSGCVALGGTLTEPEAAHRACLPWGLRGEALPRAKFSHSLSGAAWPGPPGNPQMAAPTVGLGVRPPRWAWLRLVPGLGLLSKGHAAGRGQVLLLWVSRTFERFQESPQHQPEGRVRGSPRSSWGADAGGRGLRDALGGASGVR